MVMHLPRVNSVCATAHMLIEAGSAAGQHCKIYASHKSYAGIRATTGCKPQAVCWLYQMQSEDLLDAGREQWQHPGGDPLPPPPIYGNTAKCMKTGNASMHALSSGNLAVFPYMGRVKTLLHSHAIILVQLVH